MNFLGHLFLTNGDHALMLANLYGDFVKGRNFSNLPEIVQKGTILHRKIDYYIDNHQQVVELRHELYDSLPKVAGIAIDLYFDHLLAKNWQHYAKINLETFVEPFFDYALSKENQIFKHHTFEYSKEFIYLLEIMYSKRWIYRYQNMEGLEMASTGLSKRIPYKNQLHRASEVFEIFEEKISETFEIYMMDAQEEFLSN